MPKHNKKGVTIYFVVIVLFLLLGVSLGLGMIITSQVKNIILAGDSVIAIAAADAGMEDVLYAHYKEYDPGSLSPGSICYNGVGEACKGHMADEYMLTNGAGYIFRYRFFTDKEGKDISEIYSIGYYPYNSNQRAKRVLYARW